MSSEHLRLDLNHADDIEPTQRAKQALDQIRGRISILCTDLIKINMRKRTEMVIEDEDDIMEPPTPPADTPREEQDHWDVDEDGLVWIRIHVRPRQTLYVPIVDDQALAQDFQDARTTPIRMLEQPHNNRIVLRDDWRLPNATRGMPFHWTGTTTFTLRIDRRQRATKNKAPPIGDPADCDDPTMDADTIMGFRPTQQDGTTATSTTEGQGTSEQPPMAG